MSRKFSARKLGIACVLSVLLRNVAGYPQDRTPAIMIDRGRSDCLIVHAQIDRREVLAFLDTGASHTVIQGTEEQPGFPDHKFDVVHLATARKVVPRRRYRDMAVTIPGFPTAMGDVGETDFRVSPVLERWRIEAAIGMNYLKDYVLILDGRRSSATLTSRQPTPIQEMAQPLLFQARLPVVQVTFPNGLTTEAVIDTGMTDYMMIASEIWRTLDRGSHLKAANSITRYDAAGAKVIERKIVRWVEIGGVRLVNVPSAESKLSVIGLSFLDHFHCVLDFPNRMMSLKPINDVQPVECWTDASGLAVGFLPDGRAKVGYISREYPGAQCGITAGDELLTVDHQPVQDLSLMKIRERLSQAGETVHLKLKSGDHEYEVDLKLDRPFEYPPKWEPEDPDAAPRPFPKLDDEPRKE